MLFHFSFLFSCSPLFQGHIHPWGTCTKSACILLPGSAPQANSKHMWTEALPILIMGSPKMDPSLNCAQIPKFKRRAKLHTAHLAPARETVQLWLTPYGSQPAKPRASETGPHSLQHKEFSSSQTEAEMSEEGAEQTSPSEQEIKQTSPKQEI